MKSLKTVLFAIAVAAGLSSGATLRAEKFSAPVVVVNNVMENNCRVRLVINGIANGSWIPLAAFSQIRLPVPDDGTCTGIRAYIIGGTQTDYTFSKGPVTKSSPARYVVFTDDTRTGSIASVNDYIIDANLVTSDAAGDTLFRKLLCGVALAMVAVYAFRAGISDGKHV